VLAFETILLISAAGATAMGSIKMEFRFLALCRRAVLYFTLVYRTLS